MSKMAFRDYWDARLNPVMVKEVYQGFRGRSLIASSQFLLLICLFFFISTLFSTHHDDPGQTLFWVLVLGMWALALMGIPLEAGGQLRKEITDGTLDLITITNLSPWAIVYGRFQAASLKILLVFSFMGPFAIASFLLGGIGALQIILTLGTLLLAALTLCALMLLVSALPALHLRLRMLSRLLQGLFILCIPMLMMIGISFYFSGSLYLGSYGLVGILLTLLYSIALVIFSLRTAADMLTPAGIRNFARARLALALLVLVCLSPLWLQSLLGTTIGRSTSFGYYTWAMFHLYFWALLWGGVNANPSAKVCHGWERWLGDGYLKTFSYVTLLTVLGAALGRLHASWDGWFWLVACCLIYYLFFTGLARAIRYGWQRKKGTLTHYLYILLALAMMNILVTGFMEQQGIKQTSGAILVFFPLFLESTTAQEKMQGWLWLPLLIGILSAWLGRSQKHG